MVSHFFIRRPIFACVVSIIIFLLGVVCVFRLPVAQYPDIVPPTVTVSTSYPGASAEDVINSVAIPIEQEVNGVDNMIYMSSSSSSDGAYSLTVTFEVGTDPDMATVLVQNRVNIATPSLPQEVSRQGVTVKKRSPNIVQVINIFEKEKEGQKSELAYEMTPETRTEKNLYLANYTSRNISDAITRVHGVGEVLVVNKMDFSMRIWLDPNSMAALGVSVSEITAAIEEQNVQVTAGRLGQPPVPAGQENNWVLVTQGRLTDVEQFENMTVRTGEDGSVLRLKDVALVSLGGESYQTNATYDGRPTCAMIVYQLPGANALQVADNVKRGMQEMEKDFDRDGIGFAVGYDATQFVRVSIKEVIHTLVEAVFLVVLVVYVFLQDWRAALIPTLTIPVSLVGTFFMMYCLGFSNNTLTLFGLILVIGIVVDDAIVVVENTQRIIDEEPGISSFDAALKSMLQVSGPIFATTLVLMSVFIPTAMIGGIVGLLYQQFALTIAGAVLISSLCALTFAPALSAIFLRPSVALEKKFLGFRVFNFFFDSFAAGYLFIVKRIISSRVLILGFWVAILLALYYGFTHLPTGFIPDEDQGVFFVDIRLPEGASQERTTQVLDMMQRIIDEDRTGIRNTITMNGFSVLDFTNATNVAAAIIVLEPWEQRPARRQLDAASMHAKLSKRLSIIPDANIFVFSPPAISGMGISSGVAMQLLDKVGVPAQEFYNISNEYTQNIMEEHAAGYVSCTFNPTAPRIRLDVDRDRVKRMGIPLSEVFGALRGYYGSVYVNDFNVFERVYRVTIQAAGDFRRKSEDVLDMKIKNSQGEMLPLRAVATTTELVGPQVLPRYNMFTTASITAISSPGQSSGQTIAALASLADQTLPEGISYDWTAMTYQEQHAGTSVAQVFALSIIFAFLVLAAQYESWSTPIIIMMAVPLGVGGAFLAVFLRGLDINIYTQIGLILMVGLSAKNAILITEFAVERRREGEPIIQAAYEAGRLRLRPIMMTSFAFILGIFPLVIASGAGAASRHAIGTAVFGGMLTETMVGVFVTPTLFVCLTQAAEFLSGKFNRFLGHRPQRSHQTITD